LVRHPVIRIARGEIIYDLAGYAVSGAGDFNGAAYLVFGKSSGFESTMKLSELDGNTGFRFGGVGPLDRTGSVVSPAGDVNGDGFDDVIIGAPYYQFGLGASYVVFGQILGSMPH
jgi:hypothetical protein